MHYDCIILTDDHHKDIEYIAAEILAPYSEEIKVAPYDRDCVCISNQRFKKLVSDSDTPCPSCNGKGSYPSTHNPVAKWDYYQINHNAVEPFIDGQTSVKKLLDADCEFDLKDIFALVEPDGSWHELCSMFDICTEKQSVEWPEKIVGILQKHQTCRAILCDMHI